MKVLEGDCLTAMQTMALLGETVHAVVTDPPYHLTSVVKRFGGENAAPAQFGTDGAFARASRGFMGKQWDGGDIAMRPETWRLCRELLPPGGHLVAFGGTRTFHRMAVAIEDAGFEIRDTLMWLYGTGFPKSHNLPGGWGTALKPAWEPIILARKPLVGTVAQNVLAHGTGALNVDACRVGGAPPVTWAKPRGGIWRTDAAASAELLTSDKGRWPANVVHDGSDEVEAAFAAFGDRPGQLGRSSTNPETSKTRSVYGAMGHCDEAMQPRGDSGSASRFFYSAKAGKEDRAGSKHPTVKPVALMRWLVRMVCPPGGTVLDPFAGSGTTGAACQAEGFDCVLMEREAEYLADIRRRLGLPDTPTFAAELL